MYFHFQSKQEDNLIRLYFSTIFSPPLPCFALFFIFPFGFKSYSFHRFHFSNRPDFKIAKLNNNIIIKPYNIIIEKFTLNFIII